MAVDSTPGAKAKAMAWTICAAARKRWARAWPSKAVPAKALPSDCACIFRPFTPMETPMTEKTPIKVAIVDDDEGIRATLATLIRRAPALRLAGDYPDAETALKEIPNHPPDVVLMDINLPGMKGV